MKEEDMTEHEKKLAAKIKKEKAEKKKKELLNAGKNGNWDREVTEEEAEAKLKHIDEMTEEKKKVEPVSFQRGGDFEYTFEGLHGDLNWESAYADEF